MIYDLIQENIEKQIHEIVQHLKTRVIGSSKWCNLWHLQSEANKLYYDFVAPEVGFVLMKLLFIEIEL